MEESSSGNKNKILMVVIIALLVVLLAAMVFVAIMVMSMGRDSQQQGVIAMSDLRLDQQTSVELSGPIATNLRSDTGNTQHVFSANFVTLIDNTQGNASSDIIELVSSSDSIVRGTALHVVRGRTFEELSHPDAMSILEQEILEQLRHEFGSTLIHRVMITNWFVN